MVLGWLEEVMGLEAEELARRTLNFRSPWGGVPPSGPSVNWGKDLVDLY